MPLSEHEQRLLEQMELALAKDDPKFAMQMRGPRRGPVQRAFVVGAIGFLLGLGLVVLGVMSQWWIGVVGFVVMVAAGAYAFAPRSSRADLGVVDSSGAVSSRPRATKSRRRPGGPGRGSRPTGDFMQRLEERWERRRNDPGW